MNKHFSNRLNLTLSGCIGNTVSNFMTVKQETTNKERHPFFENQ